MKNNTLLSISLVLVVFLANIIGQQLSEQKCKEYSKIAIDSTYLYPHLVSLGNIDSLTKQYKHYCNGALISDRFVLSAYDCIFVHIQINLARLTNKDFEEHVIVENSDNDNYYGIKRIVRDNSSEGILIKSDIALLELNETITLNIYKRPACLFTNENVFNTYGLLSIGWLRTTPLGFDDMPGEFSIAESPVSMVGNTECQNLKDYKVHLRNGIGDSNFCIQDEFTDDSDLTQDSYPLQFKQNNSFYIIGVVSTKYNLQPKVFKLISSNINYIENIVWNVPLIDKPVATISENKFDKPKNVNLPHECGEKKIHHKPLITFSMPTYHGEFPWHVALYLKETVRDKKYICGGSIINENMVLTAAHCVVNNIGVTIPDRLVIAAGKHHLDRHTLDSREYEIYEVIPHQKFNLEFLEYDIAILKVKNTIQFSNYIQPICLTENSNIFASQIGFVAGWGKDESNQPSNILTQATLPIQSNTNCRESNRKFFPHFLNDFNYCAGYGNGTIVCTGDSGGGMMFEYEGRWYIKGIVSLGVSLPTEERCDITELVLFTDVPKFYDWILSNIPDIK